MAVQPGLCRTWSETSKAGFLLMRLNVVGITDRPKLRQPSVRLLNEKDNLKEKKEEDFLCDISGAIGICC